MKSVDELTERVNPQWSQSLRKAVKNRESYWKPIVFSTITVWATVWPRRGSAISAALL